jgi:hypothetical protein
MSLVTDPGFGEWGEVLSLSLSMSMSMPTEEEGGPKEPLVGSDGKESLVGSGGKKPVIGSATSSASSKSGKASLPPKHAGKSAKITVTVTSDKTENVETDDRGKMIETPLLASSGSSFVAVGSLFLGYIVGMYML